MSELVERLAVIAARLAAVQQAGPTFQEYEIITLSFRKNSRTGEVGFDLVETGFLTQ
jgi:hypothetical protein